MTYDELERFKVEADRWVACVTTDGSCSGEASRGLRELIQKVHDRALSETPASQGKRVATICELDGCLAMRQYLETGQPEPAS